MGQYLIIDDVRAHNDPFHVLYEGNHLVLF